MSFLPVVGRKKKGNSGVFEMIGGFFCGERGRFLRGEMLVLLLVSVYTTLCLGERENSAIFFFLCPLFLTPRLCVGIETGIQLDVHVLLPSHISHEVSFVAKAFPNNQIDFSRVAQPHVTL